MRHVFILGREPGGCTTHLPHLRILWDYDFMLVWTLDLMRMGDLKKQIRLVISKGNLASWYILHSSPNYH